MFSGAAYVKLRLAGTANRLNVHFLVTTLCETAFQKLELVLSWAALHFGWVEPIPGFVGFRCTQPNLHFAGVIANCETQQQLISRLEAAPTIGLSIGKLNQVPAH